MIWQVFEASERGYLISYLFRFSLNKQTYILVVTGIWKHQAGQYIDVFQICLGDIKFNESFPILNHSTVFFFAETLMTE